MNLVKNLYIIRHGETQYNKEGIVQGSGVDTDLNEKGLAQADAFFEAYQNVDFHKIYTSLLKRSIQSVQKFVSKGIPVEHYSGLNEINWGDREGRPINENDNIIYKNILKEWNAGHTSVSFFQGESPVDVAARQKPVVDLILSRPEEKEILICMHGRAMRILLTQLLGLEIKEMDRFEHENLCLYKLNYDYTSEKFKIEIENDASHLKAVNQLCLQ